MRGGPGPMSGVAPIALNVAGLGDPNSSRDVEIYSILPSGYVYRYRYYIDIWDSLGVPGPAADTIGIQAWTDGSPLMTHVFAAAKGTPYDSLVLAETSDNTFWSWPSIKGGPLPLVQPIRGNIFHTTDGTNHRIWYADSSDSLDRCEFGGDWCTTKQFGRPSDTRPRFDHPGAVWAQYGTAYPVESLGNAVYLYGYDTSTDQWQNHLAPRDSVVQVSEPSIAEYTGDEFFGTVIASAYGGVTTDTGVALYISNDDGSHWSPATYAFHPLPTGDYLDKGDATVSFDGSGNAFAVSLRALPTARRSNGVWITWRDPSTGAWSNPPYLVPTTVDPWNIINDRPWLIADRYRPGFLYLVGSTDGGESFTYCDAASPSGCVSDPGNWCPPYLFIQSGSCSGAGASGNQIVQAGDGSIWVIVCNDADCGPPTAGNNLVVGIRKEVGSLGPPCQTPSWSAPTCISYSQATNSSQLVPNGLGTASHWSVRLDAARDSNTVSVAIQSYRNLAGSGVAPCVSTATQCRADIFFAELSPSDGLCGLSCGLVAADPSSMLVLNTDQASPLLQVDHTLPAVAALDYDLFGVTWKDARLAPTSDQSYTFYSASISRAPFSPPTSVSSDLFPVSGAGVYYSTEESDDVDDHVDARLHAHFLLPFAPVSAPYTPQMETVIWSPHTAQ